MYFRRVRIIASRPLFPLVFGLGGASRCHYGALPILVIELRRIFPGTEITPRHDTVTRPRPSSVIANSVFWVTLGRPISRPAAHAPHLAYPKCPKSKA